MNNIMTHVNGLPKLGFVLDVPPYNKHLVSSHGRHLSIQESVALINNSQHQKNFPQNPFPLK